MLPTVTTSGSSSGLQCWVAKLSSSASATYDDFLASTRTLILVLGCQLPLGAML